MIAPKLAEWAVSLESVPGDVREAAKRHILDGVGCAIAGVVSGVVDPVVKVARGLGGPPEATIFGASEKISAPSSALANGALIHALDFDDTHAGGLIHSTSVVVPAAFAVGQQVGASGEEVLTAAVIGYEAACRIAAAAPHGFHARGLHATMVAGVFSSALVAARLMGLNAQQTTDALGVAGSQAGGLLAFIGTGAATKQLHPGFASQSGIIAARLAAEGAAGPETVFDGPHGIFDAFVDTEVNPSSIVEGLGTRWETTQIGIKPYPACQLSHAALDATKNALETGSINVADIERIDIKVHPDSASVVCDPSRDLTRPTSPYAAKFSLPWSVAALALDGTLTTKTFQDENIVRADVTELAAKVNVQIEPFEGVAADAPGDVVVHLRDNTEIRGQIARSAGGPDTPLSQEMLEEKFLGNAGQSGSAVIASIYAIDAHPSIENVLDAITTAVAQNEEL